MRRSIRVAALHATACAIAAFPSLAEASAPDTFGFGARAEGLAGAATADAVGVAAAFHNPGGVARASGVEAMIGYSYGASALTLDGRDARTTSPRGTSLGLAIPVGLTLRGHEVRVAFGIALYLPDQYLLRIQLVPAAEPHFVLLDNSLGHLVVVPVVSIAPTRWLSLGAGATLLADAAGNGVSFDVGVVGGQKVGAGDLDVALPVRMAPVAGVVVQPRGPLDGRLRVGLAYRGSVDSKLALDVLAKVDVAGAVKGDALISLRSINLFQPQRLSLGVAVDALRDLTVTGEIAWVNWAAFRGGVPSLAVRVNLGISPPLVKALFPADHFGDVWVPRLGVEWRHAIDAHFCLAARAGYAYERSPVPDQTGLTSFADSDRHVLALGATVERRGFGAIYAGPLAVDLAGQWHELERRVTVKDPRVFPGSGFTSGGRLFHLTATLRGAF